MVVAEPLSRDWALINELRLIDDRLGVLLPSRRDVDAETTVGKGDFASKRLEFAGEQGRILRGVHLEEELVCFAINLQ